MKHVFLILLNFLTANCSAMKSDTLEVLTIRDFTVEKILNDVIAENKRFGSSKKDFILINITGDIQNNIEIRVTSIEVDLIQLYLEDKTYALVGYLEFKDQEIIVLGRKAETFFSKTDIHKILKLKRNKKITAPSSKKIPPDPPSIYEPMVWLYSYVNGDTQLVDQGRLDFFSK